MIASAVSSLRASGGGNGLEDKPKDTPSDAKREAQFTATIGMLPGCNQDRRRPVRLSRTAAFFRVEGGGVAVESALAIAALVVVVFGGLMAIVHAAYTDDRMGRAARAAARAVALETDTSVSQAALVGIACEAIRQELGLKADFDCATAWTVSIKTGLSATALAAGVNADGETGDMVLVELGWSQVPWARAAALLEGSGAGTATGLARREPAIQAPVQATDEASDAEEATDEDSDAEESTEEQPTESSASRDDASARWASRAASLGTAPQALTEVT